MKVRLLFVDDGSYHHETIELPSGVMDTYDRLIDALREEPSVLARAYIDVDRLCSAHVVSDDEDTAPDADA